MFPEWYGSKGMSSGSPQQDTGDAVDFAAYVASIASELSRLAQDHRLVTLSYLLEMVTLEARGILRAGSPPAERE